MPKDTARITTLATTLKSASNAYYNSDRVIMSDEEFDTMVEELRDLDPSHPFLASVGAPPDGGKKVAHEIPMMSLNKATTEAELGAFMNNCARAAALAGLSLVSYVGQPKLDGASGELVYRGGKLVLAISRGNGKVGQDILASARRCPDVPQTVKGAWTGSVRGEFLLPTENWEKIKAADPSATNPRNVGNGIVQRSTGEQAEMLHFRAFDIVPAAGGAPTETEKMRDLLELGFKVPDTITIQDDLGQIMQVVQAMGDARSQYSYALDGVVIKVDQVEIQEAMGVSSERPNGQIAYKWQAESAETVLVGVAFTVGHTGYIAPTGILAPVLLAGTTVSRVLLNNWDEIRKLDVALGDTVQVVKRGEIIPKVERVLSRPGTRTPIEEPTTCPVCGGKAGKKKQVGGESVLTFCLNDDCAAKTTGKVKRWLKSLEILGIGDELLRVLTTESPAPGVGSTMRPPFIGSPAALYRMRPGQLEHFAMGKGTVGKSRAASICAEIAKKQTLTLDQFLGSLGLPYLGKRKVAIIREKAAGDLDQLDAWRDGHTLLHLANQCEIAGIAPAIVAALESNRALIDDLLTVVTIKPPLYVRALAGTQPMEGETSVEFRMHFTGTGRTQTQVPNVARVPESEEARARNNKGYCFVLTGSFPVKKAAIHAEIEAAGHSFGEDMRKGETTHLVQADPSIVSNKTKKAAGWEIPVISLEELRDLLK